MSWKVLKLPAKGMADLTTNGSAKLSRDISISELSSILEASSDLFGNHVKSEKLLIKLELLPSAEATRGAVA